ncbi:Flp1 family type IVb pilin [Alkaliphilus serpentinus]|uniref:Putative Flagellin Flp1-like domain-containing protein n=1 Tax=Alkaliphilus serpentinus TaxID=1482731 RepID=A0A833HR73_9FIRM|nr:Flp1 family type IVb pilin [Alkaliphilus serpentinus]KAB3532807.1 hypothetical protein F8153_01700 [Alkaliphilus serpentinus]
MLKLMKSFWLEEDGLGTVEIVLIIAVLVALALIFKNAIIGFVRRILDNILGKESEFLQESLENEGN